MTRSIPSGTFDQYTGAMYHGDTYIRSNGGKWVRYDRVTGKMIKGLHYQDGDYYYFDQTTGAMAHGRVGARMELICDL